MTLKRKLFAFALVNVFAGVIGMQKIFCQNADNYLAVVSSLKTFSFNSASTLEAEQIQTNAFAITVKSRNNSFYVYANISNFSSTPGYVLPSDMLSIKLNTVVPSRTANFTKIPVTAGNQLIIQGIRTNTSTVTYNYNMYIGPLGFDVPPGTFTATIVFTMTQP
jgi:hypothetical protein